MTQRMRQTAMQAGGKKKKRRTMLRRKRILDPGLIIDYKNPDLLRRFITDRGKIIPRRISGATQAQQRQIATAIKRARFMALIHYSVAHEQERGFAGEMQAVSQNYATAAVRAPRSSGKDGGPRHDRHDNRGGSDRAESREDLDEGMED